MTVGELKQILGSADDDLELVVRACEVNDEGDVDVIAGVYFAGVQEGCDGDEFFAIDACDDVIGEAALDALEPQHEEDEAAS